MATSPAATVYLNSHFDVIDAVISSAGRGESFRFIRSHRRGVALPPFAAQRAASIVDVAEPGAPDRERYVRLSVANATRHRASLLWPGRRIADFLQADPSILQGLRVLSAASLRHLRLIDDKGACYAALRDSEVPIPEHVIAVTRGEFATAVRTVAPGAALCFKPVTSIFGFGFRVLRSTDREPALGEDAVALRESGREVTERRAFVRFRSDHAFRPQIVMRYLPGNERSVDCLAHDGRLVTAIVRRKRADGSQTIEDPRELRALIERIVSRFELSGLFNVQFKDDGQGRPFLLEVNPRMSGGIAKSFASGVVLPYWALRFALGTASIDDLPRPKVGIRVPATPADAWRAAST